MAQDDIVATITRAINQENLKLMSLTDFAPTQTTSLQPGNFTEGGATEWAQNLQKCKEILGYDPNYWNDIYSEETNTRSITKEIKDQKPIKTYNPYE